MSQKILSRAMCRVIIALVLTTSLIPITSSPVAAMSVGDYFQISYSPTGFSETEIYGTEVFYTTIEGQASCTEDLPLSVSEAQITSRVTAEHQVSGASVILNPSYTITIKPFPDEKGEMVEINTVVSLQFPEGSEPGGYDVVGELTEAEVKTFLGWIDVTGYLPSSQAMGSVIYTAAANSPPNTPSKPLGQTSGYAETSYSYLTSATDPDGDQVKYTFDWGDDTSSETGFVDSATIVTRSHTWGTPGAYHVKAKATDSKGASSGWSDSRKVTISTGNNPPNQPSNPSPENHATGVSINADLSWTGGDPDGGDTVTYDVYFGTSENTLLVSDNQTGMTYAPGILSRNTKYYWKVVATDSHGASASSLLWDFTTVDLPSGLEMHVSNIEMGLAAKCWGFFVYATATLSVVDDEGNPMPEAEVSGYWSGAINGSDSGITNSQGKVTFISSKAWNAVGTIFAFTVDDVTKSGWTYNSNVDTETSGSIAVDSGSPGGFFRHILWLVKQVTQKLRSIFS